jgi:hypothetical protein
MQSSTTPQATVRPGAIRSIFDHLILGLTPDGEPGQPSFLFSHYRFRWAADGPAGSLAFLEHDLDGRPHRRILTDRPALAERHAADLGPRAWSPEDRARPAASATFAWSDFGPTVTESVEAADLRLDVTWSDLSPPVFADGPAPAFPALDIISVLGDAGEGTATIDGRPVPGRIFRNDGWIAWLGRPLRSGVIAIGEVLLERG